MANSVDPASDIHRLRAIADKNQDRMIFADGRRAGAIESSRNNVFGRIAVWLRKTFTASHSKTVDLAYDRFAGAPRVSHAHRGAQELGRVDALLAADRGAGKPLTSRRLKQVLSQLDSPHAAAPGSR